MDPARIFTESLTPRPELENSLGPKRRFTALQRYVCSWSTSRHSADIGSVPPQPRHASLNCGEPRSSSGSLALLAAMRRAQD